MSDQLLAELTFPDKPAFVVVYGCMFTGKSSLGISFAMGHFLNNGKEVLFLTRDGRQPSVHRAKVPSGERPSFTSLSDSLSSHSGLLHLNPNNAFEYQMHKQRWAYHEGNLSAWYVGDDCKLAPEDLYHDMKMASKDLIVTDETQFFKNGFILRLWWHLVDMYKYSRMHQFRNMQADRPKVPKILVLTLDKTFKGSFFDGFTDMLSVCTLPIPTFGLCSRCGGRSTHSFMKDSAMEENKDDVNKGVIKIEGGSEKFEAMCSLCFRENMDYRFSSTEMAD